MTGVDQTVQDFIGRHVSNGLARRIFMLRIRWYAWRGRIASAGIVEQGEDA